MIFREIDPNYTHGIVGPRLDQGLLIRVLCVPKKLGIVVKWGIPGAPHDPPPSVRQWIVGAARGAGFPVYGETCPHYLCFSEEMYRTPRGVEFLKSLD